MNCAAAEIPVVKIVVEVHVLISPVESGLALAQSDCGAEIQGGLKVNNAA